MPSRSVDQVELERLDASPPLHYRVHRQLEALIVSRTLRPGARIVEGDLAQQLGVSRGPIREALQMLARDGFVDLRPRQGAFVHVPTVREVVDFFDVRRSLEMTSASLAAERITPEQAARLTEVIGIAKQILAQGKDPSADRDGTAFHAEIARIAGNDMLTRLLSNMERRSDWYSPPFELAARREAWDEHAKLAEYIVAGDAKRAMALMGKHINRSRDHLCASLAQDEVFSASL